MDVIEKVIKSLSEGKRKTPPRLKEIELSFGGYAFIVPKAIIAVNKAFFIKGTGYNTEVKFIIKGHVKSVSHDIYENVLKGMTDYYICLARETKSNLLISGHTGVVRISGVDEYDGKPISKYLGLSEDYSHMPVYYTPNGFRPYISSHLLTDGNSSRMILTPALGSGYLLDSVYLANSRIPSEKSPKSMLEDSGIKSLSSARYYNTLEEYVSHIKNLNMNRNFRKPVPITISIKMDSTVSIKIEDHRLSFFRAEHSISFLGRVNKDGSVTQVPFRANSFSKLMSSNSFSIKSKLKEGEKSSIQITKLK